MSVDWTDVARQRLARVVGDAKAASLVESVLQGIGLDALRSADDLAAFGEALAAHDGFVAAVGVSLKTYAILRGATRSEHAT